MSDNPRVGLGIIVENSQREVLIGRRIGSHAPYYSIPGGSLELGEDFEEGALRELAEETGLCSAKANVIALTNNLQTFRDEAVHFISVILHVSVYEGEPRIMEPLKCESWGWYSPEDLPGPHFDASRFGIMCFLQNKFYICAS